jgi:uncharacterized protein (TIGR04562 family)
MGLKFSISEQNLRTVLSGDSAIDLEHLEISSLNQANEFLKSYGYDITHPEDSEELWGVHRKSISLLREHLMDDNEKIPEELSDPALLGEIGNLLLVASSVSNLDNQKWACAILKVMHAYTHVKNDLFSQFSDTIQEQVLKRFKRHVVEDTATGVRLGAGDEAIYLHKFDVKPFKRTSSSVIKLLSKKQAVAISLLDRLGIRFVTKNIFDSFLVINFLVKENIISFPNVMPEQSHNNLYPVNLFLDVARNLSQYNRDNINEALFEKLKVNSETAEYRVKENHFSSENYRFMKFISRQLIEIELGGKNIHFFFPFEVQIMDYETYIRNLSGAQAHEEYKKRQKLAARLRVFGNIKPQ